MTDTGIWSKPTVKAGDRCRWTPYAIERLLPTYKTPAECLGTVVDVSEFGAVKVKWDSRKTVSSYSPAFIRKARSR